MAGFGPPRQKVPAAPGVAAGRVMLFSTIHGQPSGQCRSAHAVARCGLAAKYLRRQRGEVGLIGAPVGSRALATACGT
jgi:hypothetical protein